MKHIIIGTAGHIDHGKTTLIKAMTGCDTDRLSEEKKRGITIELGFAYFDLPDRRRVGIVDVPGHEKFIKNMTAGVCGMDLVLLIIAADEGIMPQTLEHVNILSLLGVKKSVIVLNKSDLVEDEWLELLEEEIREEFADTFLSSAPLVRVSARTGAGIDELVKVIERITREEVEPKDIHTIPRLPIDRIFTLPGFGTVITGTLISGSISKEDRLMIYPAQKECRVRNIQVHGADKEHCYAGQRVAINLSNIKKEEIKKGSVLALPESMKNTRLLDVRFQLLDSSERILKNNTRLHLLTGTDEVLCRVILLDKDELLPGESAYAQLRLEEELALRRKDRFVVRFYSPLETIGGGIVLEPNPPKRKRFREDVIYELKQKEEGTAADVIEAYVKKNEQTLITISDLARLTVQSKEEVQREIENLENEKNVLTFEAKNETYVWHRESYEAAKEVLLTRLKEYETTCPYQYGMKKAEIKMQCFAKKDKAVFDKIIEYMEQCGVIRRRNDRISRAGFEIVKDKLFQKIESKILEMFDEAGYNLKHMDEVRNELVSKEISNEVLDDILNVLIEENRVTRITDNVYTLKSNMEKAERMICKYFEDNPVITIIQIKEMFHTSRRGAKLIFDYTDNNRITKKASAETERTAF